MTGTRDAVVVVPGLGRGRIILVQHHTVRVRLDRGGWVDVLFFHLPERLRERVRHHGVVDEAGAEPSAAETRALVIERREGEP